MQRRPLAAAFAIAGAAFFLLAGYEFVRSSSSSLFIDAFGARRLPWVMALSPAGTFLLVYGYGKILAYLGARRTLVATTLLAGGAMAACYAGVASGISLAAGGLYVLREAYIVLVIEQYWSFINSTLSQEQARRVNGPICGVASLGAILGGLTVRSFAETWGTEQFVLLAAVSVAPAALLSWLAYRLGGEPSPTQTEIAQHRVIALPLFRAHRVLPLIFAVIVFTQMISTVLDLSFSFLLEEAHPDKDVRTAYLGGFYAGINSASAVLQFAAAPLLLRFVSLRLIHLSMPLVHIASASLLLVFPSLTVAAGAFLVFKALDYSVFRAAKEILYMPLPFDARYRSKEFIDAFGYRSSKGALSSLIAFAGALVERLPMALFPVAAFLAALSWLLLVWRRLRPEDGREAAD